MARRDAGDVLSGIVFDILKGTVMLTGLAAIGVYNLLKTPTMEKLRRLTPEEDWGHAIEAIPCPACQAENESGASQCYMCGQVLR